MKDKDRVARELAEILGRDSVVVDPDELRVYETDGLTIFKARPDIVVLPRSGDGVARVLHQRGTPSRLVGRQCPRRKPNPLGR